MAVLALILKIVVTGRGERRELEGKQRQFVGLFSLLIVLFHLGMLMRQLWGMDSLMFGWLHLGLVGSLGFLMYSPWKPERKLSAESTIFAGVLLAILAYHLVNGARLLEQASIQAMPGVIDQLVGWLLLVLVFEGMRRTVGLVLPLLVTALGAYAWIGRAVSFPLMSMGLFFQGTGGVWGIPLQISATIILPIFVFAGIFQVSGTAQFLLRTAGHLLGHTKGGAAKMAVVGSAGYGMVSGGAASNVAVTGSVTIPAMLRSGFKPAVAGGVESVASTGGAITPPVMGTAVFIMAALTGIPYATIIWKVVPVTLIFYVVLFLQSHWIAAKEGIGGIPLVEALPRGQMLKLGGTFFIPLAVLVTLLTLAYSIQTAFFVTIVVIAVMLLITKGATGCRKIIDGLIQGGYNASWLVWVMACAGIFIDILAMAGLDMDAVAWSRATFGDALLPLLVIAAALSLLLGMVGSNLIAYIMAVMVVIPPIINAGIPVLASHLFAFYYSIMGYITPPVCIACFVATRFANESFWKIGWESIKFSLPLWILPLFFVYRPELLMIQGSIWGIVTAVAIAGGGCILLAAATRGMLFTRMGNGERLVCVLASVLLLIPQTVPDLIGGMMALCVMIYQVIKWVRGREKINLRVLAGQ